MLARNVFFVAVNTGYAVDGEPSPKLASFYSERSSPLLYCAIVGNVVIPGGHPTNKGTAVISSNPAWRHVTAEIKRKGTKPGIQLASTLPGLNVPLSFKSIQSSVEIERMRELVNKLTETELASVLSSLEVATNLAVESGFEHIQLHAAHGYLFNLLMDDRLFDGATRVNAEIAEWLGRWKKNGVETSIRISLQSGDPSFDETSSEHLHHAMTSLPADYLDISSGFYSIDKRLIYPARQEIITKRIEQTLALSQAYPFRNIIASGRVFSSKVVWPPNVQYGICRDLIANSQYLQKQDFGCQNHGKCHYFSRGMDHLRCAQWRD